MRLLQFFETTTKAVAETQIAYHGSGAEFKRFAMKYMSSGEGSQWRGWGLYFAQEPKVAEFYQQMLGQSNETGWLYTVELPEGDKLLDFDKPWPQQPPYVREVLDELIQDPHDPERIVQPPELEGRWTWLDGQNKPLTDSMPANMSSWESKEDAYRARHQFLLSRDQLNGLQIYSQFARALGSEKAASLKFKKLGIPGHRFLDEWSRKGKTDTYNVVMYDTSSIRVLDKKPLSEAKLNEDEEEHIIAHIKEFAKQHGILIELSGEAGMIPGITVTDLYADNPGGGGGTKVLNELIKLADQHEVMLFIWPEGERNKLFYERFGFSMTQMPPQMIRVPNFDPEEFEELRRSEDLMEVEIGRTLYHGTTIERAKEIMQNGLEPKVGGLVKMAYEEYEDVVGELEPLGFAAEKEQFGAVMSAIKYHVENMLGERHMASAEDILKYGAVLVFRDGEGDFVHRSEDHDPTDYEEHPTQVEPGDWYSWDIIKPSYVLTGQPMIRLMKRMGSWPLVGAYGKDDVQDKAVKSDLIRRLINKHKDKTRDEIVAWVNKLNPLELTQERWQLQNVQEARKPREPRWDYWQFMDHYGIRKKAENLHDYVLPWVNENRPGNINKMARDPDYRMISHLALYFKLLRANRTPNPRNPAKSTLSKFEAALDTPIKVWRGGGGDYNPNRRNPRPWLSFTMDKRRVKTFSQYAGTHASPSFMLPERSRYWEIELTIPLRNVVGYIGIGGDAEVLISAKDAKNARLITGKSQIAGNVQESALRRKMNTVVEKGHRK